jgi:hypothetical protein
MSAPSQHQTVFERKSNESESSAAFIGLAQALQCADPEALFVVLNSYTLYCDAAGGEDHGFIVVAGYLSTFAKWNAFAAEWNSLLAAYNLPYFTMKHFAQSKHAFQGWDKDEERRKRFISRCAEIIADHVEAGFNCIVEFDTFNKVDQIYRLDDAVGVPYSLAARTCVARSSAYLCSIDGSQDATYIFEDGDEGKGELMRVMERDGYPCPIFRPGHDIQRKGNCVKGLVQLQAADFLAYEIRKAFKDDPTESWPVDRLRKSLKALAGIRCSDEDWGKYTENDLVELCKAGSVPLRAV